MADKIILGHDEIAHHLTWLTLQRAFSQGPKIWKMTNKLIHYDRYRPNHPMNDIHSDEFQARLQKAVRKDFTGWLEQTARLRKNFQKLSKIIEDHIPIFTKQVGQGDISLGQRAIVKQILKGKSPGFSKTLGKQLLPKAKFVYPENYKDADDIFIRNIIHNENIITDRIKNNRPFWFVDSGYTNFIHGGNKRFHRVMRNDIHHTQTNKTFPADRLSKFDSFPRPWRTDGDTILVIEPSKWQCQLYDINITNWRKEVKFELAKHTDRKVVWREKTGTRKTRGNLYLDLLDDPSIYCVVHYNSNAGTEAVWAGVPIITLGQHITEAVGRTELKDVERLYRGPIGNWLCQLSYSQFTFGELVNGTARTILEKYHV